MHSSVQIYVQGWAEKLGLTAPDKSIVEFGSLNENGTVRHLFKGEYAGIDMRPGKGVDLVMNTNNTDFFKNDFRKADCVLWLETMEHDLEFWKTIESIDAILKPGGYVIVTTRGIGFPLHNYPHDYYRFTLDALNHLFNTVYHFTTIDILPDAQKDHPGVLAVFNKVTNI